MEILICQFGTETNTFAKGLMEFEQQAPYGWIKADTVVEKFSGVSTYLGGALAAMAEEGVTPLPIDLVNNNGSFGAGAPLSKACVDTILDGICTGIREKLGQFDGIFFALHGAGVAEHTDDLEALTLTRIREIVGPDLPMMSSMDLHANMTEDMVKLSDGLFCIKEVPHTDLYDAGYRATRSLIATIRGQQKPVMALRRLPMLVTSSIGSTLSGPARKVKEYFAAYCKEHDLIDCSFVHGFSSTDRDISSASVLVLADGYCPDKEADELARFVWDLHEEFVAISLTAAEAIEQALSLRKDGYVVINESSDNPGSGCPGDGTHLLREFLRQDLPGTIMGPIFDAEAAAYLHQHQVGDHISLTVGGKTEPIAGDPLVLKDVEILNLCHCTFTSRSPMNAGLVIDYGPTARVRKGNVEFLVVSKLMQVYDDGSYFATGARLEDYRLVGLKSMNHFRSFFSLHADAIVAADTPGLRPANLKLVPYEQIHRPIFPLDEDTIYDGHWPKKGATL